MEDGSRHGLLHWTGGLLIFWKLPYNMNMEKYREEENLKISMLFYQWYKLNFDFLLNSIAGCIVVCFAVSSKFETSTFLAIGSFPLSGKPETLFLPERKLITQSVRSSLPLAMLIYITNYEHAELFQAVKLLAQPEPANATYCLDSGPVNWLNCVLWFTVLPMEVKLWVTCFCCLRNR